MNCSDNIADVVAKGDGFVFSQSLRGTKSSSEYRRWALSEDGYRASPDGEFKIKSRQANKTVHLKDVDTFDRRRRDEDVEVKVVAMWSRKYAERARHEREKVLEKSRQLVERPGAYTSATHYGAAQFVRGVTFDRRTGEVLTDSKVRPQLDQAAIDAAAALDGYYLIITSETGWDEGRILDAYRELWRIEESFRVTKTGGLDSRPVWVWTEEHIRAHFLTCYLALLIVRLSQLLDEICARADELEAAVAGLAQCDGIIAESQAIRDEVLPRMDALRAPVDEAEVMTKKDLWPFPSYGDLLFSVK
jgi:hypothetical protein